MTAPRENPAKMKVICLGLGRTGTKTMHKALDILGLGPCYDFMNVMGESRDLELWSKIGDGDSSPENFDTLLRGYHSTVDTPACLYPTELYEAYPNAKFILMTRDPATWEKSMRATIFHAEEFFEQKLDKTPSEAAVLQWHKRYFLQKYHRGRLYTHPQEQFSEHNERVKQIIPADRLLVYEVSEGWDKLVEFLGVPKPAEPFPHTNTTENFQAALSGSVKV